MNSGETYDFPLHSLMDGSMESNKTALPTGCAGSDLTMCVRPWSRLDTKVGVQTVYRSRYRPGTGTVPLFYS